MKMQFFTYADEMINVNIRVIDASLWFTNGQLAQVFQKDEQWMQTRVQKILDISMEKTSLARVLYKDGIHCDMVVHYHDAMVHSLNESMTYDTKPPNYDECMSNQPLYAEEVSDSRRHIGRSPHTYGGSLLRDQGSRVRERLYLLSKMIRHVKSVTPFFGFKSTDWNTRIIESIVDDNDFVGFKLYMKHIRSSFNIFKYAFYQMISKPNFIRIYQYAVFMNRIPMVNYLLTEKIVDINDRSNIQSILEHAFNHQEMSIFLLNRGINFNEGNNYQVFLRHTINDNVVFFTKYLEGCNLKSLSTYKLSTEVINDKKTHYQGSGITEIVEKLEKSKICDHLRETLRYKGVYEKEAPTPININIGQLSNNFILK